MNEHIEESQIGVNKRVIGSPLLRQLLICSGVWTAYFVDGLLIGAPTVFIPQIRKEMNSTEVIDDAMASWLTSAMAFSGFPCVIIVSVLTNLVGRKISFVVTCTVSLIALIMFYFSSSVNQILISEIMQGVFSAAQIIVSLMILTEYTSPKYRGLFLTIKCVTIYWGIWVANALGTFFHWKSIGLVGIASAAYMVITSMFWPESPYWLLSKERYTECAENHRWLKGSDYKSEKELENLINSHKEYVKKCPNMKQTLAQIIKGFFVTIAAKEFYKPILICHLIGMLNIFSGKLVFSVYAIDIIKKITGSSSTAYTGMLILDGITVLSMYIGCSLTKMFRRRVLFLVSASIGVLFLYVLSLYLFLIHLLVIDENNIVSLSLLLFFSIAISCGPLVMSSAVYGELIPVKSRNLATCIIALSSRITTAISIKIAPYIFKAFGMHGTFLTFAILSSIVILLLYKYIPETKDKTLQEILDSIMGTSNQQTFLEESSKLMVSNKS